MLKKLPVFPEPVTSCVWTPNGQSFITGALSSSDNLRQWSLAGHPEYTWTRNHRISDVAITADGNLLVCISCDQHLYVYNLASRERELEVVINLEAKICSIDMSQNLRHAIIHCQTGETRMYDLETGELVRTFVSGDKGGEFVIRSVFGGANESFIVTGSEGMTCSSYSLQMSLICS